MLPNHHQVTRTRWPRWAGASVLVHGLLAMTLTYFIPAPPDTSAPPLTVTLVDAPAHDDLKLLTPAPRPHRRVLQPQALPDSPAVPGDIPRSETHELEQPRGAIHALALTDISESAVLVNAPSPTNASTAHPDDTAFTQAHIAETIRVSLNAQYEYPHLARMRGMEGTVILGMHVTANGTLERIHLKTRSGYRILDDAALSAANNLPRVPNADEILHGLGIDVTVPVIYRLIEG